MADYIKLTEAGTSHTFIVKAVNVVTTGKWPDLHFIAESGETIVAPKMACDRQLVSSLKLTDWQQTIGLTLTISRSLKLAANGHPFWNVDAAAGGYAQKAAPAAPKSAPNAPNAPTPPAADPDDPGPYQEGDAPVTADLSAAKRKVLEDAYLALYERCAVAQVRIGSQNEFPVDGASINAMASTIFIAWNNRGVSP